MNTEAAALACVLRSADYAPTAAEWDLAVKMLDDTSSKEIDEMTWCLRGIPAESDRRSTYRWYCIARAVLRSSELRTQ